MTTMSDSTLEQLDPNFVIVFEANKDSNKNESRLIKIFENINLQNIIKATDDKNLKFAFTRIDNIDQINQINQSLKPLDFISKKFPLYDNNRTKKMDSLYRKLFKGKFSFNNPKLFELEYLADLTNNPRQSLYFMFFNHYNKYLKYLSIFGMFFYLTGSTSNPSEFNKYYTFICLIGTLLFVTSWIYKYQNLYGNLLSKSFLPKVSQYDLFHNKYDKDSTVLMKKISFIPISIIFVMILITIQLTCFFIEIYIGQIYNGPFILTKILSLVPTILLAISVQILTLIYNKIFVDKFVHLENGSNPNRSKMEKNFVLLFFTNYSALFITLFFYLPFGYLVRDNSKQFIARYGMPVKNDPFAVNTQRHQQQFFYFIFTNQLVQYATEYIVPVVLAKLQKIKSKKDGKNHSSTELSIQNEHPKDYKSWKKAQLYHTYIPSEFDVDSAYRKLILQLGFVAMFSPIWPLAPLIILLINQIVLKTDIWKCFKFSRPALVPMGNTFVNAYTDKTVINKMSMAPWDDVLKIITWISVIVAPTITFMYRYCYLPGVGMSTKLEKRDLWYDYNPMNESWSKILIFAVFAEHAGIFTFVMLKKYFKKSESSPLTGIIPSLSPTIVQNMTARNINNSRDNNKTSSDIKSNSVRTIKEEMENVTPAIKKSTGFEGNDNVNINNGDNKNSNNILKQRNKNIDTLKEKQVAAESMINNSNEQVDNAIHKSIKNIKDNENDLILPSSNSTIDSSAVYNNNFGQSHSSVAGATLPEIIPTSRNYNLRYDESGKRVSSTSSIISSNANQAEINKQRESSKLRIETENPHKLNDVENKPIINITPSDTPKIEEPPKRVNLVDQSKGFTSYSSTRSMKSSVLENESTHSKKTNPQSVTKQMNDVPSLSSKTKSMASSQNHTRVHQPVKQNHNTTSASSVASHKSIEKKKKRGLLNKIKKKL